MKHALITGATGFIGSNLVRVLNKRGIEVTIFRRPSSKLDNLKGCQYHDFIGSLANQADIERAMEDCDAVFHLAGDGSFTSRDKALRVEANIDSARTIVYCMEKKSGRRLVHCSSVAAVGLSTSPEVILDETSEFNAADLHYFYTKRKGEEIALDAAKRGLDVVVVNPATVLGPHGLRDVQLKAFKKVAQGKMKVYPPGGNCFTSVYDVIDGMLFAFEKGKSGERYILGGHNLTYKEYLGKIAACTGKKPPWIRLPGFVMPLSGGLMEMLFGSMGRDAGKLVSRFGFYSSQKAERELGYKFTPIDKIIKSMLLLLDKE